MRSAPEAELNFTAASALDSLSRRNGTPHTMSEGQVKVCYGVFSKFSNYPSVVMLDRFFNQISIGSSITSSGSQKAVRDGYGTGSWNNITDTTVSYSTLSINSSGWYTSNNKSIGEFGLSSFDLYSNGGCLSPAAVGHDKHAISFQFIDSDHKDRSIVYIYNADTDTLTAIDRLSHFPKLGCESKGNIRSDGGNISSLNHGGMSYNANRKELIALAVESGTSVTVKIWSGVDFDRYPSPTEALTAAGVTINVYTIPLDMSYIGVAAAKPVLTNAGNIYFVQQAASSSVNLYKVTPDRVAGSGGSAGLHTGMGVNNINSSTHWDSPKKMQSRDGSTVFTFSQYYSYGGGLAGWIIDKTKDALFMVSLPDTNTGGSAVPFGDAGWAFTYGSTGIVGNTGTMNNNLAVYERLLPSGQLTAFPTMLKPKLPWVYSSGSNTDYPVLFHVADYALLTDQSLS